jgi:hypothetical protein
MSANSVDSDQYVDNSIDIEHLGTMIGGFLGRQGGSATDWLDTGTTNYTSGINPRMQCGACTTDGFATVLITFPVAFSYKPAVFALAVGEAIMWINGLNATNVTINSSDPDGAARPNTLFFWLAIGPE